MSNPSCAPRLYSATRSSTSAICAPMDARLRELRRPLTNRAQNRHDARMIERDRDERLIAIRARLGQRHGGGAEPRARRRTLDDPSRPAPPRAGRAARSNVRRRHARGSAGRQHRPSADRAPAPRSCAWPPLPRAWSRTGRRSSVTSGSTAVELAHQLVDRSDLTVITNSLDVAQVLLDREGIQLVVLGGVVRPRMHSLLGHLTEQACREMRADTLFMGIGAISLERRAHERLHAGDPDRPGAPLDGDVGRGDRGRRASSTSSRQRSCSASKASTSSSPTVACGRRSSTNLTARDIRVIVA